MRRPVLGSVLALLAACSGSPPPGPVLPLDEAALDASVAELVRRHVDAVRTDPADARAHGTLGLVYEANELWDEAQRSFANAAALDPSDALWRYHRAIAMRQAGDVDGALDLLERSAAELRDLPGPQHRLGTVLLEAGRVDEAQAAFQRTVDLAPRLADGWVGLADVALYREDYAKAAELLEEAVRLDPGYKAAQYSLGLAYRGLGRLEEAGRKLTLGMGAPRRTVGDPLTDEAAGFGVSFVGEFQEAVRLIQSGNAARAAEILEKILERDPQDTNVLNNLASAYLELEDFRRMEELLLRAVRVDERQFAPHLNLAVCYLKTGRLDEASTHARRAVELAPTVGKAQFTLGRVLIAKKDLSGAYLALQRALDADARDPGIHMAMAQTCARLQRFEEARRHYLDTIQRAPSYVPARVDLVGVLMELGRWDDAAAALDEVARIEPDHPALQPLRARIDVMKR